MKLSALRKRRGRSAGFENVGDRDGVGVDAFAYHLGVEPEGVAVGSERDVGGKEGGVVVDARAMDGVEDLGGVLEGAEGGGEAEQLEEDEGVAVLDGLDGEGMDLEELVGGFASLQEGDHRVV